MSLPNVICIAAGDRAGLLARRDALIEANLDLVRSIARQMLASLPPSFELDDLIAAGNLGLLHAATRYRPSAHGETPFSAYARPVIRGAMLDSVKRSHWREATHAGSDEIPERPVVVNIEDAIDARRRRTRIDLAVAKLDERGQAVIGWHYDEEMTLRDVGERLGVGKSRASQLHVHALGTLRDALAGV